MNIPAKLAATSLRHCCDTSTLKFETTAELDPLQDPLGQDRAVTAVQFGIRMTHSGYNLYLLGSEGLGKLRWVREMLEKESSSRPVPDDLCYVNNFADPAKPLLLKLPPGKARSLQQEMEQLVEDLLVALPSAFQSDEYRNRTQELEETFKERHEAAFSELGEKAREQGVAIMGTPTGYTLAPVKDEVLLSPEAYEKLPEEEKDAIEKVLESLRKELRDLVQQVPSWQREHRQKLKKLRDEVSQMTVGQILSSPQESYKDFPQVLDYLEALRKDVIENVEVFFDGNETDNDQHTIRQRARALSEYSINVLVDNSDCKGAPIIYEDNPTYQDLIGRVEHVSQMGALLTDFTLIKPGALHLANGGYLLLDVRKILSNPFAYDGLKRALASREIRIQSLEQMLSLASTLSLEPEPIPLDIKVVLLGDRLLYYLLKQYDPEFGLMFKVAADFSEDLPRSTENTLLYARLIASLLKRDELNPLSRNAVAAVIEECSRRAGDGVKVSLDVENLGDLLREADYISRQQTKNKIETSDVVNAIKQQEYRHGQFRERVQESIQRDIQLIDTDGSRAGQINALSVIQLGDYAFGRPSRITATVRLGDGKFIDIEREVKLGGELHSKGVMILSACLANSYAQEHPLPISASLVFEQSYGMVDGDSASTAELCVLLSALANLPLRQDLAITGSINQHGEVQAIGGVNEKIEGFFELCLARGLSGSQGVIIPKSNLDHLMLRDEVIQAVKQEQFSIYAIETADEAMALLTGLPAGDRNEQGEYPSGTFNQRIQNRIAELWELQQQFNRHNRDEKNASKTD